MLEGDVDEPQVGRCHLGRVGLLACDAQELFGQALPFLDAVRSRDVELLCVQSDGHSPQVAGPAATSTSSSQAAWAPERSPR